ncbi:hypothetical protein KZ770_10310 [Escherichia coli]|nr:hypothetical protein [Escherichia coli]
MAADTERGVSNYKNDSPGIPQVIVIFDEKHADEMSFSTLIDTPIPKQA